MAYLFGYDTKLAGCFTRLCVDQSHGLGASIEFAVPLTRHQAGDYPVPDSGDPAIVTDVAFAQREKFYLVDCFNDSVFIYAFGRDASSSLITVTTLGFMSNKGADFGLALQDSLELYSKNRLSKTAQAMKIHIGLTTLSGVLVGMRSNTQDLTHQLQNITYDFLALEVQ
jgi:hypothetical protein